jgi:hypothetical protein
MYPGTDNYLKYEIVSPSAGKLLQKEGIFCTELIKFAMETLFYYWWIQIGRSLHHSVNLYMFYNILICYPNT